MFLSPQIPDRIREKVGTAAPYGFRRYHYICRQMQNFKQFVGVRQSVATVRKRIVRDRTYYYLEHTARIDGHVRKRELYLGRHVPKDLERKKREFLATVYRDKWNPVLDRIREGYANELRRTPPSAQERLRETFATIFTYNSQLIEGSTLTLRETAALLERGFTPSSRPIRDVREAEAHRNLFLHILDEERDLTFSRVLAWHRDLFKDTRPDIAGRLREHAVSISGSRFIPPSPVEVYPLLRDFFRWYARSWDKIHTVELAALVHLKFVTIHPFSDGNGRVSRLLMNFVLHRHHFPMFIVAYVGRDRYYTALERAQVNDLDSIFLQWFLKRYVRAYRRLIGPR